MDIRDIRLANLRTLIREHADGNVAKFVDVARLESHAVILHITGPKRTRNLGFQLARTIERNLALEAGWIDRDHTAEAPSRPAYNWERMERAVEFYASVEKLSPKIRNAVERLIEVLQHGQRGR